MESLETKACNENYKYLRLYRNLYNPEFYLLAYQRIQAKPGNMTEGTDGKTIDGMGMKRIYALIESMKDFSYQPAPARRTYIPKANGKRRPLGVPSFNDKLVQEVVRLILEAIFEPTFLNSSHGFRPSRSCHTALMEVKGTFTGVKWFVEGDIKGCFDNIDHHVLVELLRRRIADEHFIALIWKFLRAGYMEDWIFHDTYSGTPQGSIISPILSNIYLSELDKFMKDYAQTFRQGDKRRINPAYKKVLDKRRGREEWLKRNEEKIDDEKRHEVKRTIQEYNEILRETPYGDPMDENYKRLVYVRYADDFLIGVIGDKSDAEKIKSDVGEFLLKNLKLEMSEEKTLVTQSNRFARFLGYDIAASNLKNSTRQKNGTVKRSYTGRILLSVPKEKWVNKLISYGALKITHDKGHGNKEIWKPTRRPGLLRLDDLEIINQYNAEIRGIYNYYRLAYNATVLNNFIYFMKFSMLKTFAGKYRTRISRISKKYRHGKDFGVDYMTKKGVRTTLFHNTGAPHDETIKDADPDVVVRSRENRSNTSLIERLENNTCELCGKTGEIEMHHVRKLKDLKGKAEWERQMIARRRKTLALCLECHDKLHAGKLD